MDKFLFQFAVTFRKECVDLSPEERAYDELLAGHIPQGVCGFKPGREMVRRRGAGSHSARSVWI